MIMKTKSNRVRYKEMSFTKYESFKFDPISMLFWVVALIVFATLYNRTVEDEPSLTFFDSLFMVMLIMGLLAGSMFILWEHFATENKLGIYMYDFRAKEGDQGKGWENAKLLIAFGGAFIATTAVSVVVKTIQALSSIEAFLFFTFAAIAEEYFYRFFIATALYMLVYKSFASITPFKKAIVGVFVTIITTIISVVLTSVFFWYSHFTSYAGNLPGLMIIFFMSLIYTTTYLYTKTLFPSLTAHLLNNFIVAYITFLGSGLVV